MNLNDMKINAIADCYKRRIDLGQLPEEAEQWIRENANTGSECYSTAQIEQGIGKAIRHEERKP